MANPAYFLHLYRPLAPALTPASQSLDNEEQLVHAHDCEKDEDRQAVLCERERALNLKTSHLFSLK